MNIFSKKLTAGRSPLPGRLQDYNRLVLQNQEESYSLAFDLLGDENLACKIVEEAFEMEFQKSTAEPSKFRLEVLRLVVQNALKHAQVLPCPEIFGKYPAQLSNTEKLVCILVDCLELSYQEAAVVLGKPLNSIRKTLAETRFTLINGSMGKR